MSLYCSITENIMDKEQNGHRTKSRMPIMIIKIAVLIFLFLGYAAYSLFYIHDKREYTASEEIFYNPLMGFAVNADYIDAVSENTLIYVDITWREWEPYQGKYAGIY